MTWFSTFIHTSESAVLDLHLPGFNFNRIEVGLQIVRKITICKRREGVSTQNSIVIHWSPKSTIHEAYVSLCTWFYHDLRTSTDMVAIKFPIGDQNALRLNALHKHGDSRGVGPNAGKLAVAGSVGGLHKLVADSRRKHKGIAHIFPIRPAKNESFQVLLHEGENLVPIAVEHGIGPKVGMKLNVFESAYVTCPVDGNSPAQYASIDANNPMPPVFGGTRANPVVAIDQRDVRDRGIERNFSFVCRIRPNLNGPRIGLDVFDLLIWVIDGHTCDGGGASHLDESRCVLLAPAFRRHQNGSCRGLPGHRRNVQTRKMNTHLEFQMAFAQPVSNGDKNDATV